MSDTSSTHVSFEIPTSEPERQASDEFEMALQQTEFIRQQSSVILGLTGEAEGGVGCDSSSNAESDGDDDGDKKPASADAGDTQETPIPKLAPEIAATTDASPGLIPGVHYEVQDSQPLLGKEYLESRKHVEEDKNETSLLAAPSSGTHGNCPTYEEKGYEPASVATDPGDASIAKASEGSVNLTEKQPGAFKMLGSCLQEENGKDVPSMESTSDFSLIEAGNEEEKAKSGEQEGTVCQLRDDNNAQSSEEQSEVAGAQQVASSQEEGLVVAAVLSPGEVGEEDIEAIVQERLKEERRNAAARPSIVATATKVRLEEEGIVLVPKKLLFFFSALFVALLVIAVGFGFAKKKRDGKSSARYDDGVYEVPTLEAIEERGRIICRIWPEEEIKGSGFSIDLCRALSAAIFNGDAERVEFNTVPWSQQWRVLKNGTIDVLTHQVTSNMERDVLEPNSGFGVSFTTPFQYSGTIFAGVPEYVQCADDGETLKGICSGLKVCVLESTTTISVVLDYLDHAAVRPVPSFAAQYKDFVSGLCNAMASEPLSLPEKLLREEGYTGEYTFGSRFLSKEPLAIVTRGNDAEFLDLCNWVINSLFAAEAMGITQEQAWKFPSTNVFGGDYRYLFKNVIATIGNYGEFTERHFEFQRQEMNQLASGNSGLLYVHPFGTIELEDASKVVITPKGTMEDVEGAQHIRCGVVVNRPGFASSSALQGYSGMDIDFCRALSVAMFSADGQTIEYVEVASSGEGFQALAEREIDIFAGAPFNMENDVLQPTTGQGFSFSPPYFYGEPDAFGSPTLALALATREEDPQWSDFVRWVVWCTMYAEEAGLSSDDVGHMPLVDLFGVKYSRMFRYVILELGNYADIYARNMGSVIPRSGANKLNDGLSPLMNPWTGAFQRG